MLFMPDCITTLETQYTHFIEEISRGQQSTGRQGGCILQGLGIYGEGANVSVPPPPPPAPLFLCVAVVVGVSETRNVFLNILLTI